MSIRFDCLSCSKNIVVHDRFEGRQVRCPVCNIDLTVPKIASIAQQENEQVDVAAVDVDAEDVDTEVVDSKQSRPSKGFKVDGLDQRDVHKHESRADADPVDNPRSNHSPKARVTRSIRSDHHDEEDDLEWDITPMVDVGFLLLIFFMLTASFSIQKVIRTAAPQSDSPSSSSVQIQQKENVESITVQVDEFNAYTVISGDGETLEASSKQELISILRDIRLQFGDQSPRIIIQAHVDSMHGATVGCMDAAREAEFTRFQMFAVETFDQ